jgi:cell division protein FtsW (lipid II flippase)
MKQKFFYQPDLPTTVTCWSYTLIILLISILLWLEITVFQVWTVLVFLIFLILSGVQLYFRQVELTDQQIVLRTVIPQNTKRMELAGLQVVKKSHGQLVLNGKHQSYQIYLLPAKQRKLYNLIKSKAERS